MTTKQKTLKELKKRIENIEKRVNPDMQKYEIELVEEYNQPLSDVLALIDEMENEG